MMELDPTTTIRRNERAVFRKLTDGSAVILHLDSTAYHGLSHVGSVIWGLLEQPRRLADLTDEVRQAFDDVPATLDEDVAEFLTALQERDLVVFDAAPPG
jgi:hypothetical protein